MNDRLLSRRLFTSSLGALPALGLLGCGGRAAEPLAADAGPRALAVPPPPREALTAQERALVCAPTTEDIEGPFFKPGAPERTELGGRGTPLELEGRLLGPDCRPLSGSLELWHADESGAYDNAGFGFRARVPVDASGAYHVRTIVPGRYLNGRVYRPAHLHLKLHARGHRPLTTQLYFEGDPYNDVDPFVHASRIARVERLSGKLRIVRDFVLGG